MQKSLLTSVAEVAVIVLTVAFVGNAVVENVRATAALAVRPTAGQMSMHSFANASGVHFTFTNGDSFSKYACARGIVKNKESNEVLRSMVVCSGEVKPRTTVQVAGDFVGGDVEDVCSSVGQFGRHMDWSKCTYDTEDVTTDPTKAASAS